MKIGILQGRLSPPVGGHYQEFPESWDSEFQKINELNLVGLEWIITKESNLENPIFLNLNDLPEEKILSVCIDTLVDNRITDEEFLRDNLITVCDLLKNSTIKTLTIPILDESDLSDDSGRRLFCKMIQDIGKSYPDLNFAFEAELPIVKLNEIVSLSDNFYVTYDTGNITSCGVGHKEFINFFKEKIINVHIKDRTYSGKTVQPLTGDTDFDLIFKELSLIGYSGPFILQTARAASGEEFITIKRHKEIFEELYDRYF